MAGGFITVHREIEGWGLYQSLDGAARHVVTTLLLMTNWKDSEFWYGRNRVDVKRGQLVASEDAIAARAGVSRKVVRTLLPKLEADEFLSREKLQFGPRALCRYSIRNYDAFQSPDADRGQDRAKTGPRVGQEGALSEQDQPEEPEEPIKKIPAGKPPDPRHAPLVAKLTEAARRRIAGWKFRGGKDGKAVTTLLTMAPEAEIVSVWERCVALAPKYPGTASLHLLPERWNEILAGQNTSGPAPPRQVSITPGARSEFRGGFINVDTNEVVKP